jgi:GT2 family glycosyltransferase
MLMKPLDCTASIVIFDNPPEMIRTAAEGFLSCPLNVELHVVDNSQTQALKYSLIDLPIKYHFYGCNAGYGRGHNKALEESSDSRYHVILNPDIIVGPSTIYTLAAFMDENPDIGIVSPKILNVDGTIQGLNKRFPTIYDLFLRRFLPKTFRPLFKRRLDYYEMRDIGYDHMYDVPFLSGSFMFCRTDLMKKVGGFDPAYFLYFEDADLCRRVQETHRTVYYPSVSVVHHWKREAHKNWLFTCYFISSAFRYFNRWGYKVL